jgi:hypothetical protein
VAQQVRAYRDPGTSVTVSGIRNTSTGSDTVSYTLVGYLIDIP